MKNSIKFFFFLCTLCLSSVIYGQGSISGIVSDADLGETLISAYVYVEGTENVAPTDFDGKYSFSLPAGTYTLKVTYIGYADKLVTDVIVKDGETTFMDINMAADTETIDEVVISAKIVERSSNAVLLLQKKSIKIQDGISAQELSNQSVSNVASAMKKITGATVQDGKYLNVRGLGDRYSLAQLDGINIPSVDPYNNSASLDFIPTNIIDNIIASKTFTPDQPGTFTGGNVNIKSKSFPERQTLKVSLSTSYNPTDNLIKNFYTHDGQSLDFLGFGAKGRALDKSLLEVDRLWKSSNAALIATSNDDAAKAVNNLVRGVNFEFEPKETQSFLNHGIGISYGNKFNTGEVSQLGVLGSVSYKRSFDSKNDYRKAYWTVFDADDNLFNKGEYKVNESKDNPEINTFLGLSYKVNQNNTLNLKNIYNHQAIKASRYLYGSNQDEVDVNSPQEIVGRANTYTQVGVNSTYLSGKHLFPSLNKVELEWTSAAILSNRIEPGLQYFSSIRDKGTTDEALPLASVAPPTTIWRDLADFTSSSKLDLTVPTKSFWNSEIQLGGMYEIKSRDFNETRLVLRQTKASKAYSGNLSEYTSDTNIGLQGKDEKGNNIIKNFLYDDSNLLNSYVGSSTIAAGYGMLVAKPTDWLRFVVGGRYETTNMYVESDITKLDIIKSDSTNTARINVGAFLPAVSLIFSVSENSNIRVNYSKTIARPNLREIAPFAAFDPLLNAFWLGNTQLEQTDIQNYDVRYELFMQPGEIFAVSGFYKQFDNPIAQTIRAASNLEFQFVNVESGYVGGVELEVRKSLGMLSESLKDLKVGGNISFIQSQMDIPESPLYTPESRTFVGQSPILANAVLSYDNNDNGFSTSISFNHQGKRLHSIGREAPDEYIAPFNALDFVLSKTFRKHYSVKFTAKNLLNNKYKRTMEYKGKQSITTEYPVGRSFGLGLSYGF